MDNLLKKEYRAYAIFLSFKPYLAKVFFQKLHLIENFVPVLLLYIIKTLFYVKSTVFSSKDRILYQLHLFNFEIRSLLRSFCTF